jgi:MFS family permease
MVVLTAINFVNYIDRYVLAAVVEGIADSFALTDARSGLLMSMFVVVYMIASPITGTWGDRLPRRFLVAGGVGLWSLATTAGAFVDSYSELLLARAMVGIGEAGYAAVAPAIIADLVPEGRRGRMLAIFYLAIPMGSALGFGLGGAVAQHHEAVLAVFGIDGAGIEGWRVAFGIAGVPGLLLAIAALFVHEPERGASDEEEYALAGNDRIRDNVRALFRSPAWRIVTVGLTLMTFALGGIAYWMPAFLQRAHGLSEGDAGTYFGAVTVLAGLLGTAVGGWLGDRAFDRAPGGYFRISGWVLVAGAPFVIAAAYSGTWGMTLAFGFVAEFFLFLNTGPLNAALVGCVGPTLRATSVAVNVLFIHALGDAISPPLMGALSDAIGGGAAGLGFALAATAVPLVLGGVALVRGARRVDGSPNGLRTVDP